MTEPKRSAARLKAAEKILDDLFKEIRENTARTKAVRTSLQRQPQTEEVEEGPPPPPSKKE
jgi:hypothetical protein